MVSHAIIRARFLTTTLQLIAVVNIYFTRSVNVISSLPNVYKQSAYDNADVKLFVAIWLSILSLGIELFGLMFGITLFNTRNNAYYAVSHFVGSALCFWFMLVSGALRRCGGYGD